MLGGGLTRYLKTKKSLLLKTAAKIKKFQNRNLYYMSIMENIKMFQNWLKSFGPIWKQKTTISKFAIMLIICLEMIKLKESVVFMSAV